MTTKPEAKRLDPRFFPLIFDSIVHGIFTIDSDGLITSFNRRAEYLTGYKSEEVIGKPCCDVFRADICQDDCTTAGYGLYNLQERGELYVHAVQKVYHGQIIGLHSRDRDLVVNPAKGKKLTNVRASGTDDAIRLVPPREFTLEEALEFIEPDELVEVTPEAIRLRKRILDHNHRKQAEKGKAWRGGV